MSAKASISRRFSSLLTVVMTLSVLIGSAAFPTRARAASIIVTTLADDTVLDGLCSLREAITNANDDAATYADCPTGTGADTIGFSDTLGTATISLTSALPSITDVDGLTINGGGDITVSGNDLYQVFHTNAEIALTLNSVTVANGNNSDGGGIYAGGNLIITNSTFSNNNSTNNGGGIFKDGWVGMGHYTITITNSTFSGNSATESGGGVFNGGTQAGGTNNLIITNSIFSDNSSASGGGILNGGGELTITNSTFSGNSAIERGGGVLGGGRLTITNSIFSGNSANYGGGTSISGSLHTQGFLTITNSTFSGNSATVSGGGACSSGYGYLTIINSTFSDNSATEDGGGVYNSAGYTNSLTITNSTFSGNSATEDGGGVYDGGNFMSNGSNLTITNSILANSKSGGDCFSSMGLSTLFKNNLIEGTGDNACGLINGADGNIIGFDPNLGALTGSPAYFPLNGGSLAIDAGDDATCAAAPVNNTSQNGVTRPQGVHCDIGSFESDFPTVFSSVRVNANPANAASVNFTVTFSESVTGVDTSDFTLTTIGIIGASVTSVSGSGSTYTVTINTGTGNGTIRLDVTDDDSIKDISGTPLGGAGAGNGNYTRGEIYTIEKTAPSVVSSMRADPNPTKAASIHFTVTFSEAVTGVDTADFNLTTTGLTGASATGVSGSGTTYTVTVNTGSGSGTLQLNVVDNDTILDSASNPLGGMGAGNGNFNSGQSYTLDRTSPTVLSSVRANPNPTTATTVYFIVTFSEPVTGVDTTDFSLTTTGINFASITGVSGSGTTYTITVNTGSGFGTLRLDVTDNDSIWDMVHTPLGGVGLANGNFTSGETYTIGVTPLVVSISGNTWESGVTLSYTDGTPKTVISDGNGNYSLTVTYKWSGIVTPSKTGYTFNPASITYTNVLTDQTGQNYVAPPITYTISGNTWESGVTLSYIDGTPKTVISDSSGNYSLTVTYNWSGAVTPSKAGYAFSPENRTYTNIVENQTAQNYTAVVVTFTDVSNSYWAWSWIERLYAAGVTSGCSTNPMMYCPEDSVTRAQMAIFLERGKNGSAYTPPAATGMVFIDVSAAYWAAAWIEKLYADGITVGCATNPLRYCPEDPVTRSQMAIFLLRAKYGAAYVPPGVGSNTGFNDVPVTYWAAAWIEQLYAEGITTGCGTSPLTYCPEDSVTRAQMAVFLVRTFNLP